MNLGIKERVALVTGAGQGIGRQICLTLAEEGVRVAVNDIAEELATAAAAEIGQAGGQAIGVSADVTDAEAVNVMMQQVFRKWGRVDILVNNAGIPLAASYQEPTPGGGPLFQDTDRAFWDLTMDIITDGTLLCTRAVIEGMKERSWGRIINIVSDAGRVGVAGVTLYSMAKAGVVGFTKALAKEVGRYCITVNCVSPGFTETDAAKEFVRSRGETMIALHPMAQGLGRLGQPEDIASAVTFLASQRAEWITGQVLSVNGGSQTPD